VLATTIHSKISPCAAELCAKAVAKIAAWMFVIVAATEARFAHINQTNKQKLQTIYCLFRSIISCGCSATIELTLLAEFSR
jgi:hypothetical protein